MSTWKPITGNNLPLHTIIGVRGYIDNDKSKGCWYEMMKLDALGRFCKSDNQVWQGCTPVDFLEIPPEPKPIDQFCDLCFPMIYEHLKSISRAEGKRKEIMQLIPKIFDSLESCSLIIYDGNEITGLIYKEWSYWLQKHHPDDMW